MYECVRKGGAIAGNVVAGVSILLIVISLVRTLDCC